MVWHIIALSVFIIFLVLFALRVIIYIKTKRTSFLNTHNEHKFYYDRVIKKDTEIKSRGKNQVNFVFESTFTDGNIIKKYIISKVKNDKTLLIEFNNKEVKSFSFQIFCYNKNVKLIKVIEINLVDLTNISNIINLPRNTEYINFVEKDKGINISSQVIKKYPLLMMILDGLVIATFSFWLSYLVGVLLVGNQVNNYLDSFNSIFLYSLIIFFLGVYYYIIGIIYQKRSQVVESEEKF